MSRHKEGFVVIEVPLKGKSDELIEAVRVAAYRLLAPEQLLGSIVVLTDHPGSRIRIDGNIVGVSPLNAAHPRTASGRTYSPRRGKRVRPF